MVIQVELRQGVTHTVCWVDQRVKVGDIITLRKSEGQWEVLEAYTNNVRDVGDINRGWNVGGL